VCVRVTKAHAGREASNNMQRELIFPQDEKRKGKQLKNERYAGTFLHANTQRHLLHTGVNLLDIIMGWYHVMFVLKS
jgi:hypothetical protein